MMKNVLMVVSAGVAMTLQGCGGKPCQGLTRRRVSQLNYKGGSGRILEPKLNKNKGNHHQKKDFFNEICKCQKNQKMNVEKNTKKSKPKMIKIQKNMFLIKISPKINFGDRNCNFQNLRGHENIKNRVSTITRRYFNPKIQKHIDFFHIFVNPYGPFDMTHR